MPASTLKAIAIEDDDTIVLKEFEAALYLNSRLKDDELNKDFKQNLCHLLRENRRLTRISNKSRYGAIPFSRISKHQVIYSKHDLDALYEQLAYNARQSRERRLMSKKP